MSCFQLSDKYQEYITDSEREAFLANLQEVEDWLYEDGEDETKGVYVAKLEELKKVMHMHMMTLYIVQEEIIFQDNVLTEEWD